jgi:DNA-binding CsgD family transcriptional regulator
VIEGAEIRQLLGRQREVAAFERLLNAGREGRRAVLVVDGEPGVGKTALLEHVASVADEFRVIQTAGIEGEMQLDYAALQRLCSPLLEYRDRLPDPQGEALDVAFGLSAGQAPNAFFTGLAVLGLLAVAAEQQPVLCLVDDAQWLDGASTRALALIARRLSAERVALVLATRSVGNGLARLPQLRVGPLGRRDARALLESVLPARLDESVVERIVAETRGNPLALLELPSGLSPAQLAGGFGLTAALSLSGEIEESFRRRLARLPYDARRLVLLAAAEPLGDLALLWRAADTLGIGEAAPNIAESAGLLTLNGSATFRHPLVRSAVYGSAEPSERREVHRALADATDPTLAPDRRAWHRAQAASMPDEEIASDLERSAARAQARGGFAAAAAFLERAVELSPEPSSRARRALTAAQAMFQAGGLDEARDLLVTAESSSAADHRVRGQVQRLRAQISFASRRGSDATPRLLAIAQELEPVDPGLARATYLEALAAAAFVGRLAAPGGGPVDVSRAALAGPAMPPGAGPSDLLLQGLALRFTEGYTAGATLLKAALSAFQLDADLPAEEARWLWLASRVALDLWDDASWAALSTRHLDLVRQTGEVSVLPIVLSGRSGVYACLGDLRTAALLDEELNAAIEATGIAAVPYGRLSIAALRGDVAGFSELVRTVVVEAEARDEGHALAVTEFLSGTLYNGLGRYEDALEAVAPSEPFYTEWQAILALTELIEAAVRLGQPERARSAFEHVEETTRAAGTDWGLGIEARSRALLSDGDDAEELYTEAITRLARTSVRVQLARAHLLYGEWLRRERRRVDARVELRTAYELFRDFGVDTFAERARLELEATGEHARKRTADTLGELTPQELQIARLAAEGHTNKEIATRLFISTSTVEYHLRKTFRKLGVTSRTQLARRIDASAG